MDRTIALSVSLLQFHYYRVMSGGSSFSLCVQIHPLPVDLSSAQLKNGCKRDGNQSIRDRAQGGDVVFMNNRIMDYILLSGVRPEIKDSRIKARVCRKWDVYNLQGKFLSADFVFADEQGNHIHSVVWGNLSRRLNDKLTEGFLYFIKKFSVLPNRERYRVVQNDCMLELNGDTVVKRVYEDTNAIPRHAFELVDLDSLEPNADEHFVDAIGIITIAAILKRKMSEAVRLNF